MKLTKLHELLQRELTRKEFMRVSALMILSLIGVTEILSNMDTAKHEKINMDDPYAYGVTSYGDR